MGFVEEVKKKKEFSGLPDSVVERAIKAVKNKELGINDEFLIKESRKWLRKYFGVFLTNRILKGKGDLLEIHMSSKKRNYQKFYEKIFEGIRYQVSGISISQKIKESSTCLLSCGKIEGEKFSVIDLGCGVNGFSYPCLKDVFGDVSYVGFEAAGQLVEKMNIFFEENGFDAQAVCGDLFDIEKVVGILKETKRNRVVFLFQVVDALESVERNFSLKLIGEVMKNCEILVISVPLVSLGGGKKFAVKRKWLVDFLEEKYKVLKDFEMFGERVLVVGNRI